MKFAIGTRSFLIVPRKKPTEKKTASYLLEILPCGTRRYISSLYPTDSPKIHRIEVNGTWYYLSINDASEASIKPVHVGASV
jgi:hypothetical protein